MDSISSLFHHVALVSENEGWYEPLRFSPERIADYEQNRPYAPYSRCAAGVTLEFETEADEIAFDYEMLPFSAGKSLDGYSTSDVFDVYENGVYALTVSPAIHKGRFRYRKQNPGRVRFCIYTPVGAMVRFSRFSLGDFSPVPAPQRKLLIVGDSISQGLFGTHPSLSAAARLSRELDADLLNASIGGDCFRPGLIPEDLPWRPDAIVVELGTNDFCFIKDRKTIEENVRGFFCDLDERFSHVPCVVVSPFWMTDWDELTTAAWPTPNGSRGFCRRSATGWFTCTSSTASGSFRMNTATSATAPTPPTTALPPWLPPSEASSKNISE